MEKLEGKIALVTGGNSTRDPGWTMRGLSCEFLDGVAAVVETRLCGAARAQVQAVIGSSCGLA